MRRVLAVVLFLVLVVGCGRSANGPSPRATAGATGAATSTATATARAVASDCSAARMKDEAPEKQGTPEVVADVRTKVIQHAKACDYEALGDLAVEGGSFNYSFGEPAASDASGPASYWERLEKDDEPVTETLVRLLRLRPEKDSLEGADLYVWPAAAAGDDPSEKERESVEDAFKDENVDEWFTQDGYLGPRAGITTGGDWLFYVTGGD